MHNISFDDGYKSFSINNDENKVIKFSPADYGILERFSKARKTIVEAVENLEKDVHLKSDGTTIDEIDEAGALIAQVNKLINDQIDYIFNAEVSNMVFGRQSPISSVKGIFLFERFLDAVSPILQKEITEEQKASQKRIKKYTSKVM
ncbi:MAG: hypothetical protein ACK5JH_15205 [Anaerocolumna sp.]